MDQPLFRVLPREEFNKLSLDDRLAYMQRLMAELRGRLAETKRQLEESKRTLAKLTPLD